MSRRCPATRRSVLTGISGAAFVSLAGCTGGSGGGNDGSGGDGGGGQTQLTWGSSTSGTYSEQKRQVLSLIMEKESDRIQISPQTTAGSSAAFRLLGKGELNLAIAWGAQLYEGWNNVGKFEDADFQKQPIQCFPSEIRNGLTYYTLAENDDIETVEDFRGKSVYTGAKGSRMTSFTQDILRETGVMEDVDAVTGDYSQLPTLVRNGDVEAWSQLNISGLTFLPPEIELIQTEGVKHVETPRKVFESMAEASPFVTVIDLKPERFTFDFDEGQLVAPDSYPAASQSYAAGAITPDHDEDLVYHLVKTVMENVDMLEERLDAAKYFGFGEDKFGFKGLPKDVPFHPGATRYYKEIDVWPDDFKVYEG